MMDFNVPLSKTNMKGLVLYMKNTFHGKQYQYRSDEIERGTNSIKLRISTVAVLYGLNLGVYARDPIEAGQIIGYYEGERVDLRNQNPNATYLMHLDDNIAVDATNTFNWTRFMNHSDFSCNCDFQKDEDRICVKTMKCIKAGEQLLTNYSGGYVFSEKFYLHPTHNWHLPISIVNSNRNNYVDYPSDDFQKLLPDDRNIFLSDQFALVSLTKLCRKILKNSAVQQTDLANMVECPSYFFRASDNQNITCLQEVTPLMLACFLGSIEKVTILLQNGADPLRATLKGGRNSFVFTVLSKVSAIRKKTILELLIEKFTFHDPAGLLQLFFVDGKDSQEMSFFDYLCESDVVSSIVNDNLLNSNLKGLRNKFLCGDFSNKYSDNIVDQLSFENLSITLPNYEFSDQLFKRKYEKLVEELDDSNIEFKNYLSVKMEIDRIRINEIGNLFDTYDDKLSDGEKSFEMYKEVFCHCIAHIKSNVDYLNINRASEVLTYINNEITWEEKISMFSFTMQNIIFWQSRRYENVKWNSKASLEYIKRKLSNKEYNFIVEHLDKRTKGQLKKIV